MDWESAPEFGRRSTLLEALQRLQEMQPGPACIVETGTLRDERERAREGDGWSTVAFGWYAQQTGGRVYTVDNDPAALEVCKRLTTPYAAHIEYVCADSLVFLRAWDAQERGAIDLLYLDSLDYHEPERSEMHQLAEAQAALPALARDCLVLLDDTHPAGDAGPDGVPPLTGKGTRALPFLLEQGFQFAGCAGGQALLSRGELNRRSAEAQRKARGEGEQRTGVRNLLPSSPSLPPDTSFGGKGAEPQPLHSSPLPASEASGRGQRRSEARGRGDRGAGETKAQDRAFPIPKRPGRSQTNLVPLCEVERHFEFVMRQPALVEYLASMLRLARGGRTCEVGIEPVSYGAIWLSRQGVEAEG